VPIFPLGTDCLSSALANFMQKLQAEKAAIIMGWLNASEGPVGSRDDILQNTVTGRVAKTAVKRRDPSLARAQRIFKVFFYEM
jgi:hypothetical protein